METHLKDSDRIRLAEWVGWVRDNDKWHGWIFDHGNGHRDIVRDASDLPDPSTDERDCHQLIRHLNGLGFWTIINIHKDGSAHVMIGKGMETRHQFECYADNYMLGVCELSLKIMDKD